MKSFIRNAALCVFAMALVGATTVDAKDSTSNQLYLLNNSRTVPGPNTLLKFDVDSKTFKTIASHEAMGKSCVSSAVTCGDTFYCVWANVPIAAGVLSVNLTSLEWTFLTLDIPHALTCDGDSANSVLVLKSEAASGSSPLTFHLVRFNTIDGTSKNIGDFPQSVVYAGYDNAFKFDSNGKLYASFPNNKFFPKITSGALYSMDVATGNVEGPFNYPFGIGMPYEFYPVADKLYSSFWHTQSNKIKLCTLSLDQENGDESSVSVTDCANADFPHSSADPMPVCNGKAYAIYQNIGGGPGTSQTVTEIDLETKAMRTVTDLMNVVPYNFVGSVACA